MQPLNYTTKAIEAFGRYDCPGAPGTAQGLEYLANKLDTAEIFILPDHGELMDRSKERPEVPGLVFKPPFPVVALEYSAATKSWGSTEYNEAKASRRIALAWEWSDDLPPLLKRWAPKIDEPGICIASICYFDEHRTWMPVSVAAFIAYDCDLIDQRNSRHRAEMMRAGQITTAAAASKVPDATILPLMPEPFTKALQQLGTARALDHVSADLMDEVNAYIDLCMILSCKNVDAANQPVDERLNRRRIKAGAPPLKPFHVLTLNGDSDGLGASAGSAGRRPHLRRGHIRRLGAGRITWVNATMVSGRGEQIQKHYGVSPVGDAAFSGGQS